MLIISGISPSFAGSDLFLVAGCPNPKGDTAFPASLYRCNSSNQDLTLLSEIIDGDVGTEFIRAYHDERILMAAGTSWRTTPDGMVFAKINMDSPSEIKYFKLPLPELGAFINAYLLNVPERGKYQAVDLWKDEASILYGIDLESGKQQILPWEFLQYVKITGRQGIAVLSSDIMLLKPDTTNGLWTFHGKDSIRMQCDLPKGIEFANNDIVTLAVNNDRMMALTSKNTRLRIISGRPYSLFHVYDKKENTWRMGEFEGSWAKVSSFGDWIAGCSADRVDSATSENVTIQTESNRKHGFPFSTRMDFGHLEAPGILFLYDIRTGKKYTIETNQGDSEILLVEENVVYYRVNDRILKAKIGKESIGEPELVVEGEIVPDIHWAFMGPEIGTTQ